METKIGTINGNSNTVMLGMMESAIENALASYEYEGSKVTFNRKDDNTVMVNATEMAKPFGKQPKDWLRTEQAQNIINAVTVRQKCLTADLVRVTQGGSPSLQGTWMHEDVALVFAQWLSPEFYLWCNDHIKELLKTGSTSLDLPHDYLSALEALVAKEKERLRLEQELIYAKPKVEYFDALVDRNTLTNFRDTAKELHCKQNDFIKWLLNNNFLYRDAKDKLKPYASATDKGLFEIKEWQKGDKSGTQTLITPKGRETFRLLMNQPQSLN